ncbi:MAG TPA: bacillithiol biosynthesis deacetylase BshB2 [Symbiobacteriaceae bacterium]|nr:bacillithiol biosynthesis deacetylase BshB2 [Symbiobacteriaceae bacterium]
MERQRHVMVILPHPDDETLACGGTMALYRQAGTPVTVVCGTLGEMGRNMGKPPIASRESLPALREQELREACSLLGVADVRLMGLRDKTIEFLDPDWLAGRIRTLIDEVRPSLVITYHPLYSVHPDHMAMGAAVIRAVGSMPAAERPPVHMRAFGSGLKNLGPPDLVVDATPVLALKMTAAAAHRSQTQASLARMEARAAEDPTFKEQMLRQRSQESYWFHTF